MNPIAGCAEELNAEWLSVALGREVRSFSSERIGTGQTSSTYRVQIDADGCPATLVAKLAEGDEAARRQVATAHRNEVGFYLRLAGTLDVRTPLCWYGSISDDGTQFTLLLEDLSPRQPGRQVDGCPVDQMEDAVRNLAALHACRWNDESLHDVDFLVPLTGQRAEFLGGLASTATEQFIARFSARLDGRDVATLRDVAEVLVEWLLARPAPFTLVHGDYRLDNLMFPPAGNDVVAVDWQTVTLALPARDLSYFIATSLPADERRGAEESLVETYYDDLLQRGVEGYTADQCFDDYRFGQLQGPMITVLGTMTSQERSRSADEMFLAMASRSCAAVRDLGSLSLVEHASPPHPTAAMNRSNSPGMSRPPG